MDAFIRYVWIHHLNICRILGNGYFRGDSEPIMYDGVQIAEPVQHISWRYLFIILGLVMLCYAVIFIALFWNRNRKKGLWIQKSRFGFLFGLAEICLITSFSGILISYYQNPKWKMEGTFYQEKAYADEEKIYMADEAGRLIEYNYLLKEKNFIIRDVFAEKTCGGYYVDKNYIYYYVKNDLGEVTFYKTSKKDFTSEVIYKEVNGDRKYKYSTKYLGLINIHNYDNTSMEEWFEENIQNFWVDGNQLFFYNRRWKNWCAL